MTDNTAWRRYKATGDRSARLWLFERHKKLAWQVYNRLPTSNQTEDAEAVLMAALWKCLEGFDPERGYEFSTYAVVSIRNRWKTHLRDSSPHTPEGWSAIGRLHKAQLRGEIDMAEATPQEVADITGVPLCRVGAIMPHAPLDHCHCVHLDDNKALSSDTWTDASERSIDIESALAALPPRHRAVVDAVIGEQRTLQEAGDRLGITRERARQLRGEALTKLRKRLGKNFLVA